MARIYLLVPEELADDLLAPLDAHYRDDPTIEPIVERRSEQRRSGVDRRMLDLPIDGEDRRSTPERRVKADRRAPLVPRDLGSTLPPDCQVHASRLRWAQRLDPVSPQHAGLPTQSLVEAITAGHLACTTELYWRCYERIYAGLREHMDAMTADRATKRAFGKVLDRLDEFDVQRFQDGVRDFATPWDNFLQQMVEEVASRMAAAL